MEVSMTSCIKQQENPSLVCHLIHLRVIDNERYYALRDAIMEEYSDVCKKCSSSEVLVYLSSLYGVDDLARLNRTIVKWAIKILMSVAETFQFSSNRDENIHLFDIHDTTLKTMAKYDIGTIINSFIKCDSLNNRDSVNYLKEHDEGV